MRIAMMLLFCAAFFVGCSNPSEVENPQQTVIVVGYLTPGADIELTLRQTLSPQRYYDGLEDTLLSAEVWISTQGETFALSPSGDDPGLFVLAHETMPIVEGQTYELLIEHEGRQVHAETTVPFESAVTEVNTHLGDGETVVYNQLFGDSFGNLVHPGEFFWDKSENAAGYVVIIEAVDVRSLPPGPTAPLTGDLDRLIELRAKLEGQVAADSLSVLDGDIEVLRTFFAENLALVDDSGEPIRWLRDREQVEWEEITGKEKWSEGKKWRERLDYLFSARKIDYWIPADTTRSDFWWLSVRFEGEYRVRLQAADLNYFDYFTTSFNGQSGSDGDRGPVFHVEGGTGVFGSYVEDSFRVLAYRDDRAGTEGSGVGKMVVEVIADD